MNIEQLKKSGTIIFECISGSRAYNLDTQHSDTDIRGVFILPKDQFYGLEQVDQINNDTNDIVYYELKKFIELLKRNNPNILELVNMPAKYIIYKHPLFDLIKPEMFLSKLCEQSFVNYAYTQIKKARGLNKKILNPMEKVRKSLIDFCYLYVDNIATPLAGFLQKKGWSQQFCGLSAVTHMQDCFNLFYDENGMYKGVYNKENSNDVSLSSIPKGEVACGLLYFNRSAYSSYCKSFKEYLEWEEKRNENRYLSTISHNKNYDAKNIMHTFRLLIMAEEIAIQGEINVERKDREFLLDIKSGKFEYDDLLAKAEVKKEALAKLFKESDLPDSPDENKINNLLLHIRTQFYKEKYGN
ncbi:MAG: nucleotidyltransferase domain-containing protein [Bacteroidetes bacterium]|jgi:hypothetical protein|nr:nucleotidyltransferase domain-containing protein [Bacteroidota bacterium]MBP9795922.1 nucleotidyltransferase domain-containing protein [Chitinophagales bacterium]